MQAAVRESRETMKCIVWDLDNTIWHGVLLENDEIILRPGIKEILDALDKRGILHSIASKNNHEEAVARLKQFGILDYFIFPQINWESKSKSIATIQQNLNIGFDAMAFIDDDPFERDEVAFSLESVKCYDTDVIINLLDTPAFNPVVRSIDGQNRRKFFIEETRRNQDELQFKDKTLFLESLQMKLYVSKAEAADLDRIHELTLRTNQLNSTGYTYSQEQLAVLMKSENHELLVLELVDKYGTYGKIGVVLLELKESAWVINLLLMSCRTISRGIGSVILLYLVQKAKAAGKKLYAKFRPTDKNRMMYVTYRFNGFEEVEGNDNQDVLLKANGKNFTKQYVQVIDQW